MTQENKNHYYSPFTAGLSWLSLLLCGLILISIGGCKVYSFTGASLPADVKTVTVEQIRNSANNGPALLNQTITDALKNKLVTEASLRQVTYDGDLVFKGAVTGFPFQHRHPLHSSSPVSID
jgi:hypothetical protein